MSKSTDDAVALLKKQGYRVTPPGPKSKPRVCSVCGAVEEDVAWNPERYDLGDLEITDDTEVAEWLTRVKVEVGNSGNEGWDFKILDLCDAHDGDVINKLIEIGFGTHHHRSTHPLAMDETCPGAGGAYPDHAKCPGAIIDEHGNEYFSSPYDEEDD